MINSDSKPQSYIMWRKALHAEDVEEFGHKIKRGHGDYRVLYQMYIASFDRKQTQDD